MKILQNKDPTRKSLRAPKPNPLFADEISSENEEYDEFFNNVHQQYSSIHCVNLNYPNDPCFSNLEHPQQFQDSSSESDSDQSEFENSFASSDASCDDDIEENPSDDDEIFDENECDIIPDFDSVEDVIRFVALEKNLTHSTIDLLSRCLSQILMKLKVIDKKLPLARKILKTPRTAAEHIVDVYDGDEKIGRYCHMGLANGLLSTLQVYPQQFIPEEIINLDFFFDGFTPYDNAVHIKTMWPVLCRVVMKGIHRQKCPIIVVGIYGGSREPSTPRFITEFVNEWNDIHAEFTFNDNVYRLEISMFIGDMPARSFLCGYQGTVGANSCPKCHQLGQTKKTGPKSHITEFENEIGELRTDEEYRAMSDKTFHRITDIDEVPIFKFEDINLAENVAFCSLHLWQLGVVKRHIDLTMSSLDNRLRELVKDYMNEEVFSKYPKEFSRCGRYVTEYSRFKGNEFKAFVMHWGKPLHMFLAANEQENEPDRRRKNQKKFKGLYMHLNQAFDKLHAASRVLYNDDLVKDEDLVDQTKVWIKDYIDEMKVIFGIKAYVNPTYHQILHIPDQVKRFGSLRNCDGSAFENELHSVKHLLRFPRFELEQIYKRTFERRGRLKYRLPKKNYVMKNLSKNGKSAKTVEIDGLDIKCNEKDCYFLLNSGHLCQATLVFKEQKVHYVAAKLFPLNILKNVYDQPIETKVLNYFRVDDFLNVEFTRCKIAVKDIAYKMGCFPIENDSGTFIFSAFSKLVHPQSQQ